MTTLIHVLGSNIPHHNQTVLTYFNDVLCHQLAGLEKPIFKVVSRDKTLAQSFPALQIELFEDKSRLRRLSLPKLNRINRAVFSFMVNLTH